MNLPSFNPYQPPPAATSVVDQADNGAIHFYNTDSNLRFAESHFVLRLHPLRLIIVSVVLIVASSAVMIAAILFGVWVFGIASVVAMIVSALIYLASVYRTKVKMRQQWQRYGLQAGAVCSVETTADDLILTSPAGQFKWPITSLRTYRTRKGLMVSPEPLFCVFVPKQNQSPAELYRQLRKKLVA